MQPSKKNRGERCPENIQVVVRCRGLNKQEIADRQATVCSINEKDKEVTVQLKTYGNKGQTKSFYFDGVYGPRSTQKEIYVGTVLPIVEEVLEGYNCTIFAYGQTGTGKTFTMEGPKGDDIKVVRTSPEAGIISRSINTIFEKLSTCSDEYSVKVSHMEVYNEDLCDLLNPENKGLKIFEDPSSPTGSMISIHNLTELPVENAEDIFTILEKSTLERKTAETELNKRSSRSHCIFAITIHMRETTPEGEELMKIGKLNLVDLAGSENIGKSGAKCMAKTEAGMINKSLLTLGRVITALTEHSPHIPYRESKLTRLLQDSLGGTTKTCIIATISPAAGGLEETLSTLDYAFRAKNIRNQPLVNKKVSKKEVLKEYTVEISDLRGQLEAARKRDGVHLPLDQYERIVADLNNKSQEIDNYKDMMEVKNKELEDMQESCDRQSIELSKVKGELEVTVAGYERKIIEMKATEEQLACARNEIKVNQLILEEFRETERNVQLQGKILYETLAMATKDVDGLFKRIERGDNLTEIHRNDIKSLKEDLIEKLLKSQSEVQFFVQNQESKLQALKSKFEEFLSLKKPKFAKAETQVTNIRSGIHKGLSKLDNTAASFVEHYLNDSSRFYNMTQQKENLVTTSAIQVLHREAEDSGRMVKNTVEFTKECEAACGVSQSMLGDLDASLSGFTEKHKGAIHLTRKDFKEELDQLGKRLFEHEDFLKRLAVSRRQEEEVLKSAMAAHVKEFLSQITESFSSIFTERDRCLNEDIAVLKKNLKATESAYRTLTEMLNNKCTEMYSSLTSYEATTVASHHALAMQASNLNERCTAFASSHTADITRNSTHLKGDLEAFQMKYFKATREEGEAFAKTVNCTTDYVDRQRKFLGELEGEHAAMTRNLISGLEAEMMGEEATVKDWMNHLTIASTSRDFQNQHSTTSSAAVQRIERFDLQSYVPSNATPAKHTFSYPPSLSHTRPESEIVAQLRLNLLPSTPTVVMSDYEDSPKSLNTLFENMESSPTMKKPQLLLQQQQQQQQQQQRGAVKPVVPPQRLSSTKKGTGKPSGPPIMAKPNTLTGSAKHFNKPFPQPDREMARNRLGDVSNLFKSSYN